MTLSRTLLGFVEKVFVFAQAQMTVKQLKIMFPKTFGFNRQKVKVNVKTKLDSRLQKNTLHHPASEKATLNVKLHKRKK